MQCLIVIGQPERQPVGLAAQGRALGPARIARRVRQGQDTVGKLRPVGAEHHLKPGLLRQRPRRMGEGAFEDI